MLCGARSLSRTTRREHVFRVKERLPLGVCARQHRVNTATPTSARATAKPGREAREAATEALA